MIGLIAACETLDEKIVPFLLRDSPVDPKMTAFLMVATKHCREAAHSLSASGGQEGPSILLKLL